MYGYIYITTNLINDHIYIGKHKFSGIFDESYLGSGKYLNNAINKYSKENFCCQVIEYCNTRQELNFKEEYWIYLFRLQNFEMYNISSGGDWGDTFTYLCEEEKNARRLKMKRSPMQKAEQSKRMHAKYEEIKLDPIQYEEFCKSQSRPGKQNGMWGKHHTEKAVAKQKAVLDAYRETHPNCSTIPEVAQKISNSLKNHDVSVDCKNKLSKFVTDTISITNGKNNLRCKKDKLDYYKQFNYYLGFTKNLDKNIKKLNITNGEINHKILEDELELWLNSKDWYVGYTSSKQRKLKSQEI